jgi:TatD DNase family protein
MRLYDAHNHLQDGRLKPFESEIKRALDGEGVAAMVVNGSCEEDWDEVLHWARNDSRVIPSFGIHPWYVRERSTDWEMRLRGYLQRVPSGVGEIGLDRWVKNHDVEEQADVFSRQLRLAAELNRPVSIHCLQAWGRLLELLTTGPLPACGFVLHSFGGPQEMLEPLSALGAYFSLPGYFAHERKGRQRETFRHIPPERLLLETDAPDQLLPEDVAHYQLQDVHTRKPLNHPGNLRAVYGFAAQLYGVRLEELAETIEQNFLRLFGGIREPGV